MYDPGRHAWLRQRIYENDDQACFIERERILQRLDRTYCGYHAYDREAKIFSDLLDGVSTPVDGHDVIAGRVLEARPDPGMGQAQRLRYRYGEEACLRDYPQDTSVTFPSPLLYSFGHMTYDWEKLLGCGYRGILEEIEQAAARRGDPESLLYRDNARRIVGAVRRYAGRYAAAAREAGNEQAAQALSRVPYEPAWDLYSALSAIWLVHMIASCYEGARDFGFGRFDQYLYPYYRRSREAGMSREEAVDLLSYFLLKPNEICGRTVYNGTRKPTPCHTSKQYLIVGGPEVNELSEDVLRAAARNNMAEPVVTVFWMRGQPEAFHQCIFETMNTVADKMQVYHFDLVQEGLRDRGVPEQYIRELTYTGCCSMEFSHHNTRNEYYLNTPRVLCDLLGLLEGGEMADCRSLDELYERFQERCTAAMQDYIDYIVRLYGKVYTRHNAIFDALHVANCNRACRYPGEGGAFPVRVYNVFLAGLATTADSFHVIDRLVFREKRYTLGQLREILAADYAGYEALRAEILGMTFFGNDDDEADAYAVRTAGVLLDACDAVRIPEETFLIGSFYCLDRSYTYGLELPATPNGRRFGEYISENQSPSYGAAHSGATAELRSLSKLPFRRSGGGGYNLTLSRRLETAQLRALIESYFEMGGLHVGITYANREQLEDAMEHPERYPELTVRLYGYSEYFVKMDRWQQEEYLKRTAY